MLNCVLYESGINDLFCLNHLVDSFTGKIVRYSKYFTENSEIFKIFHYLDCEILLEYFTLIRIFHSFSWYRKKWVKIRKLSVIY
jgi:hypothetical protein